MRLKDLTDYRIAGLWLAVITKQKKMKVVAADKSPNKALQQAKEAGHGEASLMQSAEHYAAWVM